MEKELDNTAVVTADEERQSIKDAVRAKQEADKKAAAENALPIRALLEKIWRNNVFTGFRRFPSPSYNMEQALQLVDAIGKSRDTRFVIDDENRFVYENFIRWCHADQAMRCINPETKEVVPGEVKRGIYIAGNTGSGKSWCLDVMRAYCNAMGFRIEYSDNKGVRNLYWLSIRADEICDHYVKHGDISHFKAAKALAIQDLGSEPQESLFMGNRLDVIRQILETRGDKSEELTFVTSNMRLGGSVLAERYGERAVSRLMEMCNYFELKGKDRRNNRYWK